MDFWIDYAGEDRDCNRKCKYCIRQEDRIRNLGKRPLTAEKMIECIEKFNYMEKTTHDMISISGGEPLLDPEWAFKIGRWGRENGYRTRLYTNGDAFVKDYSLFEETAKYFDEIAIGIHDFDHFEETFRKIAEDDIETDMDLNIIITSEHDERYISNICDNIWHEVGNIIKKELDIHFFDVVPIGNNPELALKRKWNIIDDELTKTIQIMYHVLRHHNADAAQKYREKIHIPFNERIIHAGECSTISRIPIDAYGNVGLCPGYYNYFGNAETDEPQTILERRKKAFDILKLYEHFEIPYTIAKENAMASEFPLNYDELRRGYCSRTLADVFKKYPDYTYHDKMADDFEESLSKTNPLEKLDEEFSEYEDKLPAWQKRALKIALEKKSLLELNPIIDFFDEDIRNIILKRMERVAQ